MGAKKPIDKSSLKVETWPLAKITPYARNPRKNDGAAVDKVAASIKEFGWQQPIVVDAEGVIVVGHTRYKAAQKLGLTDAPVHVADSLTPAQVKAYRIADNRTHDEADWDRELLALEFEDLNLEGYDLLATGFNLDEIEQLSVGALAESPEQFAEFDEGIETEHQCPKCGYRWSGGVVAAVDATAGAPPIE